MRKAIVERISKIDTKTLKETILLSNDDLNVDGIIFDALLNELETRISEDCFIAFCEEL